MLSSHALEMYFGKLHPGIGKIQKRDKSTLFLSAWFSMVFGVKFEIKYTCLF
jgi:hypothetical protein